MHVASTLGALVLIWCASHRLYRAVHLSKLVQELSRRGKRISKKEYRACTQERKAKGGKLETVMASRRTRRDEQKGER